MWEPAISGMGNTHNCAPKLQAYPPIFSLTPKASGSTQFQSCEVHYNEEEEKRKLRKAEYEAGMAEGVMKTKKETAISLAEMGLSVQQIAQGIKEEEKTVCKWLDEKAEKVTMGE